MKLYVMRHGTTVWNEKGITQGRSNNRLSKSGKLLAQSASKTYAETKFEVIFSSPLFRTIQTANIMNKYHNVPIIKDANLIEIDQGYFTGKSKKDLTKAELEEKLKRSKKYGMESYEEAFVRAESFVKFIKGQKFECVLVVTHSCTATFIEDIIKNKKKDFKNAEFLRNFENAEIKEFKI